MNLLKSVTVLAVLASTLPLHAQLTQATVSAEAAQILVDASKTVLLEAEATLKVPADRAVIRIAVTVEAKTLVEATGKNQQIRETLKQALLKQGIPEDRIRSSRFSSIPQSGFLKGKSYRVVNQMAVTVESEAEFHAVALQIDLRPETTFESLEPIDTKAVENRAAALAKACDAVNRKKAAAEQAMKIKLAPMRLAEATPAVQRLYTQRAQQPFFAGGLPLKDSPASESNNRAYRTFESASDEGPGFGEKTYVVVVAAEYQMVK